MLFPWISGWQSFTVIYLQYTVAVPCSLLFDSLDYQIKTATHGVQLLISNFSVTSMLLFDKFSSQYAYLDP